MMKRCLLMLTALCLLVLALPAHAAAPEDLAFVAQTDDRFAWQPDYFTNGRALVSQGSLPCSIANALIAAFEVNDAKQAADLLRETLLFSASHHTPWNNAVDPNCLSRLGRDTEFPLIAKLRARYGAISHQSGLLHADQFEKLIPGLLDEYGSALLMGRVYVPGELPKLAAMSDMLTERGHGDAMILVTMASAGLASSTTSPFGMPGVDHYVTVLLYAEEYAATGKLYLLDSLPRGLSVPEQQRMGAYATYPFATGTLAFGGLRGTFEIERVQDMVLSVTPRHERDDAHLSLLGLVGYAVAMICIP